MNDLTRALKLKAARILNGSADLIETMGFCRRSAAKTKSGYPVTGINPNAVRFCAIGGMHRTQKNKHLSRMDYDNALHFLQANISANNASNNNVPDWNDDKKTTKKQVINKLREVARKIKE